MSSCWRPTSPEALQLAKENAVGHGVADVMRFAVADLLPPRPSPEGRST